MKSIPFFLLLILGPLFALGGHSPQETLSLLAKQAVRLERQDDALFERASNAWKKKCPRAERDICLLTEADVYPGGRTDYVLLFRGEEDRYPSPGSSVLLRHIAKNSASNLCPSPCTIENALTFIGNELSRLLKTYSFNHDEIVKVTFNEVDGLWYEEGFDDDTEQIILKPLMPLHESKSKERQPTPMELMASSHLNLAGVATYDGKENKLLDPFVSYSRSPDVAYKFTRNENKPLEHFGRMIIVSVQKNWLKPETCEQWLGKPGTAVEIYPCLYFFRGDFSSEYEVSLISHTPVEAIKDILLIKNSRKLR